MLDLSIDLDLTCISFLSPFLSRARMWVRWDWQLSQA